MENIVDALKNLYAAYGGKPEDVATITNIADMINALAALGIPSGESEPTP